MSNNSGEVTNVEYKLFDASANVYLAIGALLIAGLSGISKNSVLRSSNDKTKQLPKSFAESLNALEKDHLLIDTMGSILSTAYIGTKRAEEEHFSKMELSDEVIFALSKC